MIKHEEENSRSMDMTCMSSPSACSSPGELQIIAQHFQQRPNLSPNNVSGNGQQGQPVLAYETTIEELEEATSNMIDYGYPQESSPQESNPDVKKPMEELCPVCGDKVSGYHYGLLTCESCKGFFKRTVQNKKVYSCVDNQQCLIDKSQRKRCPYCRFKKCLEVGMKLEAVREDRMRGGRNKFGPMYKRDRALKLQQVRERQNILSHCSMPVNGYDNGEYLPGQLSPRGQGHMGNSPGGMMGDGLNSQMLGENPLHALTSQGHNMPLYPPHQFTSGDMLQRQHQMPIAPRPQASQQIPLILPQVIKDLQRQEAEKDRSKEDKILSYFVEQLSQNFNPERDNKRTILGILCKFIDQLLFMLVEWARNALYFKELKVEDQMKLLQNCWSELLILEFIYKQCHNKCWPNDIILGPGHQVPAEYLMLSGDVKDRVHDLIHKLHDLHLDHNEFMCLKFLILLNPDVIGVIERKTVEVSQERINAALLEYCIMFHPNVKDKFGQLLLRLPELRLISIRAEEFLYFRHLGGDLPEQTLLMEMLHSKRNRK